MTDEQRKAVTAMREAFGYPSDILFAPVAPEGVGRSVEPLRVQIRHDVPGATVDMLFTTLGSRDCPVPIPAGAYAQREGRAPCRFDPGPFPAGPGVENEKVL